MRRRAGGRRCGARGRGMNAPPRLPGGAGAPLAGTMTCRQELADDAEPRKGLLRKRGPAAVRRRDGAPRGATHREVRDIRNNGCALRRAIPSHWPRGRKMTADPGPQRIRAAERWLLSYPSPQVERDKSEGANDDERAV
jgi:hypothetical protein